MTAPLRFKRVLLKVSGEALLGDQPFGIDDEVLDRIAGEIGEAVALGVKVGVVTGGGNIFRGMAIAEGRRQPRRRRPDGHARHGDELDRPAAEARRARASRRAIFSAVPMPTICETFTQQRAETAFDSGRRRALRRRHRQPVLHHRFRRGAARRRDGLRRAVQGHPGRRRLFGRPEEGHERRRATTG